MLISRHQRTIDSLTELQVKFESFDFPTRYLSLKMANSLTFTSDLCRSMGFWGSKIDTEKPHKSDIIEIYARIFRGFKGKFMSMRSKILWWVSAKKLCAVSVKLLCRLSANNLFAVSVCVVGRRS